MEDQNLPLPTEGGPPPPPKFGVTPIVEKQTRSEEGAPIAPTFGGRENPDQVDWENMPKMEVASRALKAAPSSAWNAIKAIPEAIYNYEETGEGIKQLGQGIASKARGALGEVQDPSKKAETESVLNAIFEPYSSVAGFKKAIATDPFSVLSTAAIPLTGGASGLAAGSKALGTASLAGKAASIGSKSASVLAGVADPLTGLIGGSKLLAQNLAMPAAKKTASVASGLGPESLEQIYQTGKSSDQAIKDGFNTWAKGQGNAVDLSQDVSQSLKSFQKDAFKDWRGTKEGILASKADVPFDPVFKAIDEARDTIGNPKTAFGSSADAHAVLNELEARLRKRAASPPGSIERRLDAFDQLKRTMWNDSQRMPPMSQAAYNTVRNGVSDAIGDVAPKYPGLMLDYQALLDNFNTIKTTLGTKDNVAATTEILKLIKAQNDITKNQLITQLAKYDPTLPAKIAGAAVNQAAGHPSAWAQGLSAAQWTNLIAGVATMNPAHIGVAGLGLLGQKLFGSPTNVSKAAYGAGRIAGAAEPVLDSSLAKVAPYASPTFTAPLERMQGELDRQQRKSGGRVSDKLVAMVDRSKKNINNSTQSLLQTPDSHVAHALEIANRNLEG
jgi:hypothetical protein